MIVSKSKINRINFQMKKFSKCESSLCQSNCFMEPIIDECRTVHSLLRLENECLCLDSPEFELFLRKINLQCCGWIMIINDLIDDLKICTKVIQILCESICIPHRNESRFPLRLSISILYHSIHYRIFSLYLLIDFLNKIIIQ